MIRLILFDIDGTLIYHVRSGLNVGLVRFEYAAEKIFQRTVRFDAQINYNGWVDRQIAWENIRRAGISKAEFDRKFSALAKVMHDYGQEQAQRSQGKLYEAIPEAVRLAVALDRTETAFIGLLTGNVERVGRWKLSHAGIPDIFPFGLFGDEADDRVTLARTVFTKANAFFHDEFLPEEIVVIGDAIGDVRCAKAIRANSIIVTTGGHTSRKALAAEEPDVIADTLTDPVVIEFFRKHIRAFHATDL